MKIVIQQVDMDTALTAFILGVSTADDIVAVRDDASPEDLNNPSVICIEAGGSGEIQFKNFDHHNTTLSLPPACRQALGVAGWDKPHLARLVDYAECVDLGYPVPRKKQRLLTLSNIFSGMRLVVRNPVERLQTGMNIFATVLNKRLDPFGTMPELPKWCEWIDAKRRERKKLSQAETEIFFSRDKMKIGFIETSAIGAIGALYGKGCNIAIAYSPAFGTPPRPKYTIAGNEIRVSHLLRRLNMLEPGWGGPGHGTIIASPSTGSGLKSETVKEIVRVYA